jgi:tRNA 2-thiocytidine biosynthesis protein TtcA
VTKEAPGETEAAPAGGDEVSGAADGWRSPAGDVASFADSPEGGGGFRFRSKLERNIARRMGAAISDFDLIAGGDRVMVCVSGGKDSFTLLDILCQLRRRAPVRFELCAVNLDQGYGGHNARRVADHVRSLGVSYHQECADFPPIMDRVLKPGVSPCSLCSRLRRGVFYNLAPRLGCNKIALGHHLDDLCETLLMNMFYSGRLQTMPPRLISDDGRNIVIRPLCYVREADISAYASARGYTVSTCSSPRCGQSDRKRQQMKRWLRAVEIESPELKYMILAAMTHVRASHLLDRRLLSVLARATSGEGESDVEA